MRNPVAASVSLAASASRSSITTTPVEFTAHAGMIYVSRTQTQTAERKEKRGKTVEAPSGVVVLASSRWAP